MTAEIPALLENLPARRREELAETLQLAIQRELVERLVDDLDDLSCNTLEQLYRCLATNDFQHLTEVTRRSEADNDRLHAEICRRLRLIESLDTLEKREAELAVCAADPMYFIDNWVWMLDPRPDGLKRLPIVLWERQREVVEFILRKRAEKKCGLIKKSRDVGLSVIVCCVGIWFWRFRANSRIGYGSRTEPLVDALDDMDALFPKIRFILECLPHWMLPVGFDGRKHSKEMHIINPQNGSALKGEGGKNLGHGGRTTLFFADEFSLVEHQRRVHAGLTGNTDTVIFFGTSKGPQTYFYELEERGEYELLRFPWYYDERKVDDPSLVGDPTAPSTWRDGKLAEIGPALFAQEYGCDDDLAVENVLIPVAWVLAAVEIDLDAVGEPVAGIDVADLGEDESVLCLRSGPVPVFHVWDEIEAKTLAIPVASLCQKSGARHAYFDAAGIGQDFGGPFIERAEGFKVLGVYGQSAPSKYRVLEDNPRETCYERFANKLTEQWWVMRLRFRRTYEYWEWLQRAKKLGRPDDGPPPHDVKDLISIPDDPVLRSQLKRTWFLDSRSKIQVQPKKQMAKSPDRADALALTEDDTLFRLEQNPEPRRAGAPKSRFSKLQF